MQTAIGQRIANLHKANFSADFSTIFHLFMRPCYNGFMNLEFHHLNLGKVLLLGRPSDQDLTVARKVVEFFRANPKTDRDGIFLPEFNLKLHMRIGPESTEWLVRHGQHGNVYATGAIVWGASHHAQSAFQNIFNEYLQAVSSDPEGEFIRDSGAPMFPEVVPYTAAFYHAPFYRLAAMHPKIEALMERNIQLLSWATLSLMRAPKVG